MFRSGLRLRLLSCSLLASSAAGVLGRPSVKDMLIDPHYLRDYALTRGFSLGQPVAARPTPDGKAVLFLRAQARVPRMGLYEFDVATGATRELLTPEQVLRGAEERLSPEEKARRERMRISVGGFTSFQLSEDGAILLVSLSGKLYAIHRADGTLRELPTGPAALLDPRLSPDGKSVAYVRDHDLHVLDLDADHARPLTSGGTAEVSHGLAEFVAQEEMGRFSGYWWSPDARSIAYEEADATGVEAWHVADPARPEEPALPSYYPRPGKTNVRVRLGVVPVSGGLTTWIDWDTQRYPYLAAVQWEKKAPLTLTVQTRDQKELALLQADPVTGKTAVLLTESDPAWVNLNPGMPKWLEDGSGFLWTSEQGGGPRLELRSRDGALVRVLVPPEAGFHRLVDVDLEAKRVVYNASVDPTQEQLFRISLDGGSAVALTHEPGLHRADFARNHAIYVHYRRCLSEAPRVEVRRADGTRIGELPSLAETPPFVPNVTLVRVGRGRGFHAALVRPRAFDPRKRYPVLVDVYGGPRGNTVWATMGAWLLDQWLADQGFVVVSVDGRGTARRGRDWERAISRRFGSVPLSDQIAGLKALGQRFPELDLDRVGIVGWSFGGYMAALAVLKRPDIFKAAVAGAPVADWLDYDTHYTERYLGMPDTDAAAYKEASLLSYASRLRRPLLLIHGTADDNVFFRHTLKLADALFRAGKEFELLPLSSTTHMTPDPVVTERLWSRIALHFRRHLGRPRAQPAASARGKRGSSTTVR